MNYYSTGLPDKIPIDIEGLTELIENFPARMKGINDGKGIPVTVRILVVSTFVSLYYKRRQGFELGMNKNKSSSWPLTVHEQEINYNAPGIGEPRDPCRPRRLLRATRGFKIQRRGRRRERPKKNRFYKQNNSFARAPHFF